MDKPANDAYHIEAVGIEGIDDIIALGYYFWHETSNRRDGNYAARKFYRRLNRELNDPDFRAFVAYDNLRRAVGYALIRADDLFSEQKQGEMIQFYVRPEHRKTAVARLLRDAVEKQYDEWMTYRKYVESASDLDDPRQLMLFINLWRKIGYRVAGVTMIKGAGSWQEVSLEKSLKSQFQPPLPTPPAGQE